MLCTQEVASRPAGEPEAREGETTDAQMRRYAASARGRPVNGRRRGVAIHSVSRRAGFVLLCRLQAGGETRVAMAAGRRRGVWREQRLNHADVREHLDPRDRGEGVDSSSEKAARSWCPLSWEPERWRGKGLPPEVEALMTEGARIHMSEEVGFEEVPQYAWPTDEALAEGILEADRALAVGAMEYVPDDQLERVLQESTVHPWTMAQQGAKWRACHDYSVGTNRRATSAPFALPTVWDVRPMLKRGSRFAKYDMRDGFWSVPPTHPPDRDCAVGMV
jgi:hypothetical protein